MAGVLLVSNHCLALPQQGQVVGGSATITQVSPGTVVIDQNSARAVIDWRSFSISRNETTDFVQPSSSSIAFNRVTGADPSRIEGHLNANGQVVLINPNGVLFTRNAQVNVGSLIVSSSGITNANAMAGRMVFDQPGGAGASIVNAGTITVRQGGLVALVAPSVVNSGQIAAKLGKVALSAGDKWTLDLYGDRLVSFDVTDQVKGLVTNSGTIGASVVQLTANQAKGVVGNAINMSGVIKATSLHRNGGSIVLDGGGNGAVGVSGALKATGTTGGSIEVTGNSVALAGAMLDASGDVAGGTIEIGGGPRGSGSLRQAGTVSADATTRIAANATKSGAGGQVTVWSDGLTSFDGKITANGYDIGGTVETSGHSLALGTNARVDTMASSGKGGMWLLDPYDLTINAPDAATLSTNLNTTSITLQTTAANNGTSAYGTVTNNASGNISVDSAISWNSVNSLTLSAYNSILVNANIQNAGTGAIVLRADNAGVGTATLGAGSGAVAIANGTSVSSTGAVNLYYDATGVGAAQYTAPTSYGGVTAGAGATAYMLVDSVSDLNNVQYNLGGAYALGKNITAVGALSAIGGSAAAFTGIFDGSGGLGLSGTIAGATISGTSYVGLFGNNSGTIRNLTLGSIGVSGTSYVGGLAGYNTGTLTGDVVNGGTITGAANAQDVGGLVGYNSGASAVISDTVANATISGGTAVGAVGGLIGYNVQGSVSNNTVSGGTITVASGASDVGGYIGFNEGTLSGGSASNTILADTGETAGTAANDVAGFIGINFGTLTGATASGGVSAGYGSQYIGGLIGYNDASVSGGTASGSVSAASGSGFIGGLIGFNAGGTVTASTASGSIFAGDESTEVGGLAGRNFNGATIVSSGYSGNLTLGNYVGYSGGVIGQADNGGYVSGVTASGTISGGLLAFAIGGVAGINAGTITNAVSSAIITVGSASGAVGGLVGWNQGGVLTASTATGQVTAGDSTGNIGGLVGYNTGTVLNSNAFVTVSVGASAGFIGGGAGDNDSGALLSGISVGGVVVAGSGSTAIGGLAGGNGSNPIAAAGEFLATNSLITGSTTTAQVTAGSNSFAVGGLVGWNPAWTSGNSGSGTIYHGVVTGSSGTGGVTIGAGSTYVHGANQIGCDQTAGCAGTPGQQSLTITTTVGQSKVYGASNPTYTYSVSGTLESGDTSSSVLAGALSRAAGSNVGTYAISQGSLALTSPYAIDDYTVTYVGTNFAITPASLTITAGNASKTYGAANPTLSVTYTGLTNGDTSSVVSGFSLSTSAASTSNVGSYAITAAGGIASNYTITDVNGTLSVTPAPLTIAANNASRLQNQADPAFTALISGLVNGDGSGVVTGLAFRSTDSPNAAPGPYQIIPFGAVASNYAITFTPGVLTVDPSPPPTTASNPAAPLAMMPAAAGQPFGQSSAVLSQVITNLISNQDSGLGLSALQQNPLFPSQSVIGSVSQEGAIDGQGGEIVTASSDAVACLKFGAQTDSGGGACSAALTLRGY